MGSFSIWHWLIVLVIVMLIFGTKKLRNIGADLGGAVKGFKEGMKRGRRGAEAGSAPPGDRQHDRRRSQGQDRDEGLSGLRAQRAIGRPSGALRFAFRDPRMFDIGFSELMVIALVALIVIGPERLPQVARTLGHLLGRLQRYVNDVKADIDREMELDELKKLRATVAGARRVGRAVQVSMSTSEVQARRARPRALNAATLDGTGGGGAQRRRRRAAGRRPRARRRARQPAAGLERREAQATNA